MLTLLKEMIKGKRLLILGFGREGRSTLRRVLTCGGYASVTIADQSEVTPDEPSVRVLSGPGYMDTLDDYDLVFKSPGVVLPKDPAQYRCRFTSQAELFLTACRERVIGVTGTKGKSTVTTMLYHILKENRRDVILAGNIGIPVFDMLEEIGPETLSVVELSCHQLEYSPVSPHIALLLNIHEEHLDHYGTFARYVKAKRQIYLHQQPGDLLFCGFEVRPEASSCAARVYTVSDREPSADVRLDGARVLAGENAYDIPADRIRLLGHHNHLDIAFVYAVCRTLGVSCEGFTRALLSYEPLPHRLRLIGEQGGVRYYDDSISTICDTTIQALKSVPDVGSVLIGGMDRGIDYGELIDFLSDDPTPHIILMAATGKRIFEEIQKSRPDFHHPERLCLVDTLEEAVARAKKLTAPGKACVLSPAAASYGIFKNFEERGDVFAKLALGK